MDSHNAQKKRFAIIGLGRFARKNFLRRQHRNALLVAIVDKEAANFDDEAIQQISELGARIYQDVESLLSNERIDFVVISAPHDQHFPLLEQCVRAGINVLKEKPFAMTLGEAVRTKAMLASHPEVTLMIIPKRRLHRPFQMVKELMARIGTPFMYQMEYTLSISDLQAGWRANRTQSGGGCLIDMGYHYVDLMNWYFGEPLEIDSHFSYQARPEQNYDVEDSCVISTRHQSGLIGTLMLSRCSPPERETITINGSTGSIYLTSNFVRLLTKDGTEDFDFSDARPSCPIEHFADVLSGVTRPATMIEDQYVNQRIIHTCYQAEARRYPEKLAHAF